jgi:uncharacterized protein involved in exopolysaccharide biosynthesis
MKEQDLPSAQANGNGNGISRSAATGLITVEHGFPSRSVLRTPRDFVGVAFRRRRLVLLSFLGTFLGATLVAVIVAHTYEAKIEILVKDERADPVVTPEPNALFRNSSNTVSEEVINSEVELIQSPDILEKVVVACGLDRRSSFLESLLPMLRTTDPRIRLAKAVKKLADKLNVEPVKKSDLIAVTYKSSDPELAAHVLQNLAKFYLEKHLEVHRFPGTFEFFHQQAEDYQKKLRDAETRLANFSREQGAAAPQLQRDMTVQRLPDDIANWRQTQASIAGTERRIRDLEAQLQSTPPRMTTQEHTSSTLLEQLKATLVNLELKRTELLTRYAPTYPLVQDVDKEISQTRSAITSAEQTPTRDLTTDRDPTYELLRQDLAKAREDLASLKATEAAQKAAVESFRQTTVDLDRKAQVEADLTREAKADETSYLLYLSKQEDARSSDALDSRRIVNVVIARAATVPILPFFPPWLVVVLGGVLACLASAGSVWVSEKMDRSFRTPDEIVQYLDVPVLASIPKNGHELPALTSVQYK